MSLRYKNVMAPVRAQSRKKRDEVSYERGNLSH